MQTNAITY